MKFFKINIIVAFFIIFLFKTTIYANPNKIYATYTANNLTLTSYSKSWNKTMLKDLYGELINNLHGDEFDYLSNIYIYPDAPEGVNGLYFDDIHLEGNNYILGPNAYINLYNGERYNTVPKIAYTLSHEYGHHYMICNLVKSENIYYNNLKDSKYVKIRGLTNMPVIYNYNDDDNYLYHWDIMEIMADDYVQLLGSSNAKLSYDYKSVDELIKLNKPPYENPSSFNLKPQLNPYIPLAADINGLYPYLLELSNFTISQHKIPKKPKLNNITGYVDINGEPTYNVSWNNPNKNEPFEYTLVIYPDDNPFIPYPLKTLTSKEPLNVTFGSYSIEQKDGSLKSISQKYEGKYTLKLYIKDSLGFIYSSPPLTDNFTSLSKKILSDAKAKPTYKNEPSNVKKEPNITSNSKVVGPSTTGSLGDLFYINKNKNKLN
ncbi:hypothetical protein [uncultured Tyzzerella sp.]|uniref:hypothetical protein n=1 Tax=uncultured Tyzzerella sp. TaxID=2321398 RepID=UPI0029435104|nr:hypothetical protein [uncultured Tyzzerella sp.]